MPVKYKLASLSCGLILLLFIGYSLIQYQLVYRFMMESEKDNFRKTANEVAGYFSEQERENNQEEWEENKRFLERLVRDNQLFRLLDENGKPLVVIARGIPGEWVPSGTTDKEAIVSFHHGEDHLLLIRSPVRTDGFRGTMELAGNMESLDVLKDRLNRLMWVCGIAGIIISAAGGLFIARQVIVPVKRLTETMGSIKKDGLHERVSYSNNNDELSRLSTMFNGMMDELENSFLGQRRLVEDASHEFRTPIAIIEGHLKLLKRWGKSNPAVMDESLDAALQETARLKSLANQMLELTRAESGVRRECGSAIDASEILEDLVKDYVMLYPQREFHTELAPGLSVSIDANHLKQIVIIMTDNAVRYSADSKPVSLRAFSDAGRAIIEIEDQGQGIPEDELPLVFERFYRVDRDRNRKKGGSGLGLSIAKSLTEAYDGTIGIRSRSGIGTVITISLPLAGCDDGLKIDSGG
ncbi:ATP-binding protein [Cohnella faecalis]|uniref:Signal transduction histidine-protein kinase ArlS n=1 Tax=Cohnella faecalis TaxID=2315694 RepID=A0A398CWS1_9BACL|nr:HAMP domain-containing histidine kinase [Cohnella faecalis]RIE03464.1 sensor histidine kinase [Cohnella faecalis]